ncbi:MAG TPA: choice-of-anchor J domain-containing protein [Ferruginibacter sp.]|nr:choice-of-anchor J domain-containing protein [Ferruginibacter sp.]HPH89556.1 choice-of-anchor J domain-containing protein [Ferruginibacter sp.]
MKNKLLLFSLGIAVAFSGLVSCGKTETAVADKNDPSFKEDFDAISKSVSKGWVVANNSKPIGTAGWVDGFYYLSQNHMYDGKIGPSNPYNFEGFEGYVSESGNEFAMATANSGHGRATISNWLISPVVEVKNGDIITFYTRTASNPADGADRLQVRINTVNSSADVGREATSVGNFSEVLLDLNPGYALEGDDSYPGDWTPYEVVVSGMPGSTAKKSRIAFRYFVEDGGPQGSNSIGIGIDKFSFRSR